MTYSHFPFVTQSDGTLLSTGTRVMSSGLHSLTNTNVDISPLYGLQHTLSTARRRQMVIFLVNHRFFSEFPDD